MARDNKDLIVALDIGTSKVACLVAELRPDASLEILGMGGHESKGLKKGVVVNIEATVRRSNGRWVALEVERSGGGGEHGGDDDDDDRGGDDDSSGPGSGDDD